MSCGKRFARRRERYETAEAALGPEAPGAKAFAVSGDLVRAFIGLPSFGTMFPVNESTSTCSLTGIFL